MQAEQQQYDHRSWLMKAAEPTGTKKKDKGQEAKEWIDIGI
jgi:hypothetical protein